MIAILAAALAMQPAPDMAEAQVISQCMIDNSTPAMEDSLRQMMVAALTDDTAAMNTHLNAFGLSMMNVATQSCGVDVSAMQGPTFQAAGNLYGQHVGTKIVTEAFGKIGM